MVVRYLDSTCVWVADLAATIGREEAAAFERKMTVIPRRGERWIINFEVVVAIGDPDGFFAMVEIVVQMLAEKGVAVRIATSPNLKYDAILNDLFPGNCFLDQRQALLSFTSAA